MGKPQENQRTPIGGPQETKITNIGRAWKNYRQKNRTAKGNIRKNIGKQQEDQRNIIREGSGKQW